MKIISIQLFGMPIADEIYIFVIYLALVPNQMVLLNLIDSSHVGMMSISTGRLSDMSTRCKDGTGNCVSTRLFLNEYISNQDHQSTSIFVV